MNINRKVKKLGLVSIDDPIIKSMYSFPRSVKERYDYAKDTTPIMLYSSDYLKRNSYKVIRNGYEALTGEKNLRFIDILTLNYYFLMYK